MINKRQLIDANEYPCRGCGVAYCYQNCSKFNKWFETAVDAVSVDEIIFHHILIDENGIPEVKIQFGDRTLILRREDDPVDIKEVMYTQFINGQCTNCGWFGDSVETQYYNYCPGCGSYVVGDEDE